MGPVGGMQTGCRRPESPVFKPTLTVRPDMTAVCEWDRIGANGANSLTLLGSYAFVAQTFLVGEP